MPSIDLNFTPYRILPSPFERTILVQDGKQQTNEQHLSSNTKRSENENGNYGSNRIETRTWFLPKHRIKTRRTRTKFTLPLIEILKFDWLRQKNMQGYYASLLT